MRLTPEQYTPRINSILTNGEVEELYSIKNFPIFIGTTTENRESDLLHDMTFDICKKTGIIQLRDLIDPNIIYSKFHSEGVGKTWDLHRIEFSNIISQYLKNNDRVLEIGGSDGKLAQKLLHKNEDINEIVIVEPNIKEPFQNHRIKHISDFFNNPDIKKYRDFNMVIHSHTLEHAYNPLDFIRSISSILDYGSYHIFSVPNLYSYLKGKFINILNFEHTLFLRESVIDYMLSINDFTILQKYYYTNHSIFYVTRKQETIHNFLPNNYEENKETYLNHMKYYQDFVEDINKKIENTSKPVYMFGAHIFSQFLITLGLNIKKIRYVLDNSEMKNNSRLYGTDLTVKLPCNVNLNENCIIILKVAQYKDEIKNQLININSDIEFYE
jgi:2-polyprenyl-3-methyl-5-hydroxy-6-metoxy-1,4-benzoquinol methylase